MKLLRLKLYEPYRSLQFDEQKFPKLPLIKDEIDPICLVGLNGSGKSNLLELIADIFYLLESILLDYKVSSPKPYTPYSNNKKKKEIYFEIDYKIKIEGEDTFVRISRIPKSNQPIITLFKSLKFDEVKQELDFKKQGRKYLPLVVAYTSGLNDLLSMPFIELQDYYAREVTFRVHKGKDPNVIIDSPNLILMDYDSNFAVILANYLLNDSLKTDIFKDFARIEGLNSFKIVIQLDKGPKGQGDNGVTLPSEFQQIINNLISCSTTHLHKPSEKGDKYELDFLVNEVTKKLFKYYFKSAKQLFNALSKLYLLNALCIKTDYRNKLRIKRREGKLLRFPTVATLDKIFRIEQIELILSEPKVRTEYIKISDGEHQFIHIVGGMLIFDEKDSEREVLYLLDEPDTHFNPKWRSEFFSSLDKLKVLDNKNHEIILTTHSPFILGDCHGYNVFVFERNNETHSVTFKRSNYETFGANFNYILKNIFGFEYQMSNKSKDHLLKLEAQIQEAEKIIGQMPQDKIEQMETELRLYGESVEKLFVINQLEKLKEKLLKKNI